MRCRRRARRTVLLYLSFYFAFFFLLFIFISRILSYPRVLYNDGEDMEREREREREGREKMRFWLPRGRDWPRARLHICEMQNNHKRTGPAHYSRRAANSASFKASRRSLTGSRFICVRDLLYALCIWMYTWM